MMTVFGEMRRCRPPKKVMDNRELPPLDPVGQQSNNCEREGGGGEGSGYGETTTRSET